MAFRSLLTIPNNVPVRENMNDNDFNLIMRTGYMQAAKRKSKDVDEVFDILEVEHDAAIQCTITEQAEGQAVQIIKCKRSYGSFFNAQIY